MNLKTRIKKLEAEIIDISAFCLCNGKEPQVEIRRKTADYDAYATGVYVPYQDSETAEAFDRVTENEKPTLENCLKCGKPVNKRLIILNLVG